MHGPWISAKCGIPSGKKRCEIFHVLQLTLKISLHYAERFNELYYQMYNLTLENEIKFII